MGTGFKHGAGGGNPLNFKVVGNPQPSNPKENTIWINTHDKITSYLFNATQPTNPTEGMVWISLGTASTGEFNALKKNGIQVYPLFAKQYIGGSWVVKHFEIWKDDSWVIFWDGSLYNAGNEYTDITGGWINAAKQAWSGYPGRPVAPPITRNSTYMGMGGSASNISGMIYARKKIDLTGYTKLVYKGHLQAKESAWGCLAVWSSFGTYWMDNIVARLNTVAHGTHELDITNLNGEYYVGFGFYYEWCGGNMYSLKLER